MSEVPAVGLASKREEALNWFRRGLSKDEWYGRCSSFTQLNNGRFFRNNFQMVPAKSMLQFKTEESTNIQRRASFLRNARTLLRTREKLRRAKAQQTAELLRAHKEGHSHATRAAILIQKHVRGMLTRNCFREAMARRIKGTLSAVLSQMTQRVAQYWLSSYSNVPVFKIQRAFRAARLRYALRTASEAYAQKDRTASQLILQVLRCRLSRNLVAATKQRRFDQVQSLASVHALLVVFEQSQKKQAWATLCNYTPPIVPHVVIERLQPITVVQPGPPKPAKSVSYSKVRTVNRLPRSYLLPTHAYINSVSVLNKLPLQKTRSQRKILRCPTDASHSTGLLTFSSSTNLARVKTDSQQAITAISSHGTEIVPIAQTGTLFRYSFLSQSRSPLRAKYLAESSRS